MIERWWMMAIGVLVVFSGCVPTVDWLGDRTADTTFAQLQEAPDRHMGQTVIVGGKVLDAKRLQHETRIEILQLPLDSSYQPTRDLRQSQGRVIATQKTFLDPATIPAGTFITISGTVAGSLILPIDEMDYRYPIVEIVRLHVWPSAEEERAHFRPYPYLMPGPYW